MGKFDFSSITSKFTNRGNKVSETTKEKAETAMQGATQSSPLSAGLAAAIATQTKKAAEEEAKKAAEVKQETKDTVANVEQKNNEVKQESAQVVQQEINILYPDTKLFKDSRDITIDGVLPGVAFNKMIEVYGEPVDRGGNTFTFDNGMTVEIDATKNIVKKISVITGELITPEGVAVDMEETILNTTYETADEVDVKSNGADYKYFNKNKTRKFTFVSRGGFITKIESELIA